MMLLLLLLVLLTGAALVVAVMTLAPAPSVRAALPAPLRLPGMLLLAVSLLLLPGALLMSLRVPALWAVPIGIVVSMLTQKLAAPLVSRLQCHPSIQILIKRLWSPRRSATPGENS